MNRNNRNLGDTIRNILDGYNAVANTAQLAQLTGIQNALTRVEAQNVETHTRLGDRIRGGVSAAIRRVTENQGIQTWMNRLNTALLVHNALMLSSNLVQSMGYVVDTVLDIVGIRFQNAEGDEIDTNTLVGKTVYQFFEDAVGKTTAATVTTNWKKLQKIYQAGSNILWQAQSMFDATKDALNTITENSGRMGNALKRWGVVGENAYPAMPERNNATTRSQKAIQRVIDGLQTAENITSNLDSISSNVLEVQEGVSEMKTQQKELKDSIDEFRDEDDKATEAAKKASASPEIDLTDLFKKEEDN